MSLDQRIHDQVKARLITDYAFRDAGAYLRQGKCPSCKKKELFASAEKPRLIICGRKDKCGFEQEVRELYPDIFDDWSKQTRDDPSPTAAADAYLAHARHFDLQFLRGHYSQEFYQDKKLGIGSATVRFPLPNGSWWERLIDQPGRFPRKANFAAGSSYQGHVWQLPGHTIADYAAADEIWMPEGIFNAIALEQGAFRGERRDLEAKQAASDSQLGLLETPIGNLAVSLMSCYNYPEHFLRDLRIAIASGPRPTHKPRLVFALDNGAAGTEYTRKFVKQAREEGWDARAALVRLDDEPGANIDWNDLLPRERLKPENRDDYLWHGEVLVAPDEREKAYLIWRRKKWKSFDFTFAGRTFWAGLSEAKVQERIAEGFASHPDISVAGLEEKYDFAARETISVECIANCTFRALFFERNETTDTSAYWLRVDRPSDRSKTSPAYYDKVKASFPGPALAGSGEFKKRLLSVASGAIWTGEQYQLDRIMQRQLPVRDVTSIEFTGYCRDHGVYVLGDIAIAKGKVYRPNEDGYFDVGTAAIKLRTPERLLDRIEYDPDKLDTSWLADYWAAFGAKGIVLLAFNGGLALIAEQVRQRHKSLGFLEVTGIAGSGKTTAIEFIWKLLGRENYEGFDPAKSTQAGIARELAKAANLPVVFIEGDRNDDTPHSKRFDWEETKTLYNGRATRTRGVKNDGLETYSPPFRGAFTIVQNEPVNASRAVLERIMAVHFDKSGWTPETKAAAVRIENWPIENVSGFIAHACRREADILTRYTESYARHEARLLTLPAANNGRLVKNHAQLHAMVDCLPIMLPGIREEWLAAAGTFVDTMMVDRHQAVASDHPHVETFWDRFYWLEEMSGEASPINHHRDPELIAVRLSEFEQRCADRRLQIPPIAELKKHLKTSKRHPFLEAKSVNSRVPAIGIVHCWVFQRAPARN
ncbi:MAG: bifunctional DNA primase/helicase [Pseudomonadota bacterium]